MVQQNSRPREGSRKIQLHRFMITCDEERQQVLQWIENSTRPELSVCASVEKYFFLQQDFVIVSADYDNGSLEDFYVPMHRPVKPHPKHIMWRYTLYTAEALDKLHKGGLIHGNLKCSTVLITSGPEVKLTVNAFRDYLSKPEHLSVFSSPEIIKGQPVSPKSDLWALGVILYKLVEQREPFMDNDDDDIEQNKDPKAEGQERGLADKIMNDPLPALKYCEGDIALENLIISLLSKDPELRPSAEQIIINAREQIEQYQKKKDEQEKQQKEKEVIEQQKQQQQSPQQSIQSLQTIQQQESSSSSSSSSSQSDDFSILTKTILLQYTSYDPPNYSNLLERLCAGIDEVESDLRKQGAMTRGKKKINRVNMNMWNNGQMNKQGKGNKQRKDVVVDEENDAKRFANIIESQFDHISLILNDYGQVAIDALLQSELLAVLVDCIRGI
ncbi:MAG: hypothetical protein EZS28_041226, partial [Streblomastix strix]